MKVGNLHELVEGKKWSEEGHSLIVMGDYQARSSAGFATILPLMSETAAIIGGAGFSYKKWNEEKRIDEIRGKGLRPFPDMPRAVVFWTGARVEKVSTHENSNTATAEACLAGLEVIAETMIENGEEDIILCEGQSDYVQAWRISPAGNSVEVDVPLEHRQDIFQGPIRALREQDPEGFEGE